MVLDLGRILYATVNLINCDTVVRTYEYSLSHSGFEVGHTKIYGLT